MMGRTYNRLVQLLVLPGLHDTQCGFKVFTAEAAVACFEPLRTHGFGFDAEVLVRARRHGWEIAEVPVRWEPPRRLAGQRAARLWDGAARPDPAAAAAPMSARPGPPVALDLPSQSLSRQSAQDGSR